MKATRCCCSHRDHTGSRPGVFRPKWPGSSQGSPGRKHTQTQNPASLGTERSTPCKAAHIQLCSALEPQYLKSAMQARSIESRKLHSRWPGPSSRVQCCGPRLDKMRLHTCFALQACCRCCSLHGSPAASWAKAGWICMTSSEGAVRVQRAPLDCLVHQTRG